jgi:Ca2+ transporting ATPase
MGGSSSGTSSLERMSAVLPSLVTHGGSFSTRVARRFRFTNWYALYFYYSLCLTGLIDGFQTHFHQCASKFSEIGCEMFTNEMAHRATTMSLSILVVVEMFNAMNSLSENESLLRLPIWKNMWLVGAITLSMALHVAILYIPFFTVSTVLAHHFCANYHLQHLFAITPLNWAEWKAVLLISAPVIVIDELLKFITVSSKTSNAKKSEILTRS